MSIYRCDKCCSVFKLNKNLKYHIENKACKDRNHQCKYCDKKFTTPTSMYRHMRKSCETKKDSEKEKDQIYERLLKLEESNGQIDLLKKENDKQINALKKENCKQIKMLKKENGDQIDMLKKENNQLKKEVEKIKKVAKSNKNITNNTMNNINNGTINNVTLVAYGSEDMSKIDKIDLLSIYQNGYNSALKLTEAVHFNPNFPEYHNVYIANMKDKYAMLYDGSNWALTMKTDLINKIYNDKRYYIEDNLDNFLESLTTSQVRALNRWLDTDDDDIKTKRIKDRIKLLLYNLKHIPIESNKNTLRIENEVKKIKKMAGNPGTKRKNLRKIVKNL
jgi:hypothetical protein